MPVRKETYDKGTFYSSKFEYGSLLPSGRRQLFLAGFNLAEKHRLLFMQGLKEDEYYARATESKRTINSAVSFLLGANLYKSKNLLKLKYNDPRLLPPQDNISFDIEETKEWTHGLRNGFRPVSVDVVEPQNDLLLRPYKTTKCSQMFKQITKGAKEQFRKLLNKNKASKKYKEKIQKILQKYSDHFDSLNLTDANLEVINGLLLANKLLPGPKYFDDLTLEETEIISSAKKISSFANTYMMKTIFSSPLFTTIRETFKKKMKSISKNGENFPLKLMLFSTHDTTILPLLVLLEDSNLQCSMEQLKNFKKKPECRGKPPYASVIGFELLQDQKNKFYTRVQSNGKYLDFCKLGLNDGDDKYSCPIDTFMDRISSDFIFDNYKKICESYENDKKLEKQNFNFYSMVFQFVKTEDGILLALFGVNLVLGFLFMYYTEKLSTLEHNIVRTHKEFFEEYIKNGDEENDSLMEYKLKKN